MEEGGSWKTFDPMSGMKKWGTDKVRWANEEKDHVDASHVILLKRILNLSVVMTVTMGKKIFHGDEERYLFSSDSEKNDDKNFFGS